MYDQYGEEGLNGHVPPPGASAFGGGGGDGGPTAFRFNSRSPEDIFSELFGYSSFPGMGDLGGSRGCGGATGFPKGIFGDDIFGSFRSGASEGGSANAVVPPRKAPAIERNLPCTLEDLYKGTTKKMKISREILDASG